MLSFELIKQLDKYEPEIDIRPGLSMDVIMFRAGRRSIINELKIRQEWYDKNKPNQVEM